MARVSIPVSSTPSPVAGDSTNGHTITGGATLIVENTTGSTKGLYIQDSGDADSGTTCSATYEVLTGTTMLIPLPQAIFGTLPTIDKETVALNLTGLLLAGLGGL